VLVRIYTQCKYILLFKNKEFISVSKFEKLIKLKLFNKKIINNLQNIGEKLLMGVNSKKKQH